MLKRGVVALLAVGLLSLGLTAGSSAATHTVTFSTDWSVPCADCQAPISTGLTVFTVELGPRDGSPFSSTVRAFDAATGAPLWSRPLGRVASVGIDGLATALYIHEQLADGMARVVALDTRNGHTFFHVTPPRLGAGPQHARVVIDGSAVFAVSSADGSENLEVTHLSPTGASDWTKRQGRQPGAVAFEGGKLYLFSSAFTPPDTEHDLLTGYAEGDGAPSVVWSHRQPSSLPVLDAAAGHGLVYAVQYTDGEGTGFGTAAIDPKTRTFAWHVRNRATALAFGGSVLVTGAGQQAGHSSELTGFDAVTGARNWGPIADAGGNPAIVGFTVYSTLQNVLYAHSSRTGKLEGTFEAPRADALNDVSAGNGHVAIVSDTTLTSLTPHFS